MNTLAPPLASISLALLVAACGLTDPSSSASSSGAGNAAQAAGTGGALSAAGSATAGAGTEAGGTLASGGEGGAPSSGGSAVAGGGAGGGAGAGGGSAGAASVRPTQVVTSAEPLFWNPGTLSEVPSESPDVIVDDTTTYQTFDGFGGTFNEKAWQYLSLLSESDRSKALNLLFGAEGARFVFGRLPIGADEYASSRYTLDITDSDTTPDLQMEKFSISRDLNDLIPFVKAALALRPEMRFLAVPWTPPVWMKTGPFTGVSAPSAYDGGQMKNDDQTLQAFALYLSKFVQEYAKQGIDVEAIAIQREPSFANAFPSCVWSTALYLEFVKNHLQPMFAAQGLNTKIYLGLMENGEETSMDTDLVSTVTERNHDTLEPFSGFGFQWGMLKQMDRVTSLNLPILQTEHQPSNEPWKTPFYRDKAPNDFAYAVESWGLIRNWLEAGATAYIVKHMALDRVGLGLDTRTHWPQNALLVIDAATKALTVTPTFYVFDHFSHFIVPGAKRIEVTSESLDALAFKNPDGSIVTVMYYNGSLSKPVTIAVGGVNYQFTMPGNGFATMYKSG